MGWLGLPLAKVLHEEGYHVKGSVSSTEKLERLKELPFKVQKIALTAKRIDGDLEDFLDQTELLIFNIPPGRQEGVEQVYPAMIDQLIRHTPPYLKVIFTSTTGVYADENKMVNENTSPNPTKASGKAVVHAEGRLTAHFQDNLTILRLAGLIGDNRNPGRFLAGKNGLKNGDAPVNLIHQKDCIGIIQKVIEKKAWGKTINVCAGQHPLRKDYYPKAAAALGLEPPKFEDNADTTYKIVDNTYSKELLDYKYFFNNPADIFA